MRTLLKVLGWLTLGLVVLVAIALYGLSAIFDHEWSRDEVARATSPSGKVDAVLFELNGGATTSFAYDIHVVPRGRVPAKDEAKTAWLYRATKSSQSYGANLRWESENTLVVEYLAAQFANIERPNVLVGGSSVSIVLRSGVDDGTAEIGGMVSNLSRPKRN